MWEMSRDHCALPSVGPGRAALAASARADLAEAEVGREAPFERVEICAVCAGALGAEPMSMEVEGPGVVNLWTIALRFAGATMRVGLTASGRASSRWTANSASEPEP